MTIIKTKQVKLIMLIVWFCSFSVITKAELKDSTIQTFQFTLKEAVNYALENNAQIKNAKVDQQIAKKQVWETTAIGLPQASASYKFQHLPGDIPTFNFGGQDVYLGVENSATYDITVSQLVFSGEYIVGLQASKTFLQLSENNLKKNDIEIKNTVASNYYSILILEKNKAIIDSSLINLKTIINEMKAMHKAGMIQKTDVDQINLSLNSTKNAENSMIRQIEILYKLFKISLGLDVNSQVQLSESLDDIVVSMNIENVLNGQFNINQNIDYRIINTQEKISGLSLRREQSKYLPTVSAFYLYQDKTKKADFDFTINQIIGVNINVPIFSSGQRYSKVTQAKLNLIKTQNTKANVEENLHMQAEQAKFNLMNSFENYKTQQQNIELSEEIYNNTMAQYKEGMVSSLVLSQTHQQYLTEQSNYFKALLDVLNSKLNLEKVLNN